MSAKPTKELLARTEQFVRSANPKLSEKSVFQATAKIAAQMAKVQEAFRKARRGKGLFGIATK